MTIQEKLNELKEDTVIQFDLLVKSNNISKNFTRYEEAVNKLADLQLYVKLKNLDPNSKITVEQKASTSLLR